MPVPQSIEGKVAQMAKVGVQFRWHGEWQAGDAFDTLLDILELRVRFMRNSPYRFWTEASKFG